MPPARLDTLVDRLYQSRPGLTLVVAAITPLADPAKEAQAQSLECLHPADRRRAPEAGQNVLFADMRSALTPGDLSPDGVHPGTRRLRQDGPRLVRALTGQAPPPLPAPAGGPVRAGPSGRANIFSPATRVAVSNTFAGARFRARGLVDGTNKAFVFGDVEQ